MNYGPDDFYKEVNFEAYCKICKYKDEDQAGPHCDECLEKSFRQCTHKPVNFKNKDE